MRSKIKNKNSKNQKLPIHYEFNVVYDLLFERAVYDLEPAKVSDNPTLKGKSQLFTKFDIL